MEEKRFTEKESLELISQMIQATKQSMNMGSGNIFLYYGYSAVILAVVIFVLHYFTHNPLWSALWFLMFVPAILISIKNSRKKPEVVTYVDKMLNNTWKIITSMFGLTAITIFILGIVSGGQFDFVLMLPLCLLYAGIGTSITGIVTKETTLIYLPFAAFFFAIYMLLALTDGEKATAMWNIYFGVSFLFMMVIPGHIVNRKSVKSCLLN